jgi:3-phosphoshikimate 1-carboxyvinyltransferase
MDITLNKAKVDGQITISGSKSQTIRALLIATFAKEESVINNALLSEDTLACIALCKAFGATIEQNETTFKVKPPSFFPKEIFVDCANSGTTLYLAVGLAATLSSKVTFTGDEQLNERPVGGLLNSLKELGAKINYLEKENYPPFTIEGPLKGGTTSIKAYTSQYLSSLMLCSPLAQEDVEINVPLLNEKPYAEMTQKWLDQQNIIYKHKADFSYFKFQGNQHYKGFKSLIGGDYSSASFFFCAAAVSKGRVTVHGLDKDDVQGDKELLNILQTMGCRVTWHNHSVTVEGPTTPLKGGTFDLNAIPDTLPVLAVTACFANEKVELINVEQARIKETDRIAVMKENLSKLNAKVEELADGLIIYGEGKLDGGTCLGYGDHRIIMAMAIASLGANDAITILGIDAVKVTFPTFFEQLNEIRLQSEE